MDNAILCINSELHKVWSIFLYISANKVKTIMLHLFFILIGNNKKVLKYLRFRVQLSEKRNKFNQVQGLKAELELPDFVNKNTRCPVKFEIQRSHDFFFLSVKYVPCNILDILILKTYLYLSEIQM